MTRSNILHKRYCFEVYDDVVVVAVDVVLLVGDLGINDEDCVLLFASSFGLELIDLVCWGVSTWGVELLRVLLLLVLLLLLTTGTTTSD